MIYSNVRGPDGPAQAWNDLAERINAMQGKLWADFAVGLVGPFLPLIRDASGAMVGAVGVSGGAVAQDLQVATAAAAALQN